jgi:hypothetical protein
MNKSIKNLLEKLFRTASDNLTPRDDNDYSDVEDLTFGSDDYETSIPYFSTAQDFNYFNTIGMAREQAIPIDPEEQAAANAQTQIDPNQMGQDPNMAQPQVDQYGQPVPGTEMIPGQEIQDPNYLGKIYELKKIYSRLVSVESFLDSESDPTLLKLRNYVSQSIELFQMLINNISVFRETINELIIIYYKFLLEVYSILREYYKKENIKLKKEQDNG